MSDKIIANRYAKPLLELSIEKGLLEEINQDMALLIKTCDENSEFRAVLQSPVIRGYKKMTILKSIFGGKISDLTFSLFELLANRNRESLLYVIAKEFNEMYNGYKRIEKVKIVTTFALSDDLREAVKANLAKNLDKTILLEEEINPNLIGGFVLKIGGNQIDNSLKSSLQKLKLNFIQKIYS